MKSTFIVLIICITTYIILAAPSPKTASHKASIPCYQFYNDHNPETTGCPAITKTQPTTVYFDDFTSPPFNQGPGTGGCGGDSPCDLPCPSAPYPAKECWPRFLSPCPGAYQAPGSNCWTGVWGRTVVNRTANQGTYVCSPTCSVPRTTCADSNYVYYSIEQTCSC
jgi:hypothetical protein